MAKKIKANVMDLNKYRSFTLDSFWLILTYKCQFDCPWCYTQNGSLQKDMALKDAINACHLLADLGGNNVVLIGGEPLLYKHLFEVINECSNLSLNTIMITSGYFFYQEEKVKILNQAKIDRITLSFHRYDKDSFDKLVGRAEGFSHVYNGLLNLKKYEIPFEISCLIDINQVELYFDLLDWARSEDIQQIVFLTYVPLAGSNKSISGILTPKESAKIVELIYERSKDFPDIECNFVFQYPFCLIKKEVYQAMEQEGVIFGSHELLYTGRGLAIDPKGNILPGSHWVNYPLFHLDDIRENGSLSPQKFIEKWNCQEVLRFRESLWNFVSSECENCNLWGTSCTGGNPLVWQTWQDKDLMPSHRPFAFK